MAILEERNGVWNIRYKIQGKSSREKIGRVSKTVAKKALREFENKLCLMKLGVELPRQILLKDFLPEYFAWVKNKWAPKTYTTKKEAEKTFVEFLKTNRNYKPDQLYIHNITLQLIERFIQFRKKGGVSDRTIQINLDFISNFIKKAKEWNYSYPTIKMPRMEKCKTNPRFFSQEEIRLILDNATDYQKQIFNIMINTGLRVGEVLNLRWKHVDLEMDLITVANTNTFKVKDKEDRVIPINSTLKKYLLRLKNEFIDPNKSKRSPREPQQMKYVICKKDGSQVKKVRCFRFLLRKIGIQNARLYTTRHSFASHCIMNGVDIYTLQKFLGHNNISTTEIYAHLDNKHKKDAIEKLAFITK